MQSDWRKRKLGVDGSKWAVTVNSVTPRRLFPVSGVKERSWTCRLRYRTPSRSGKPKLKTRFQLRSSRIDAAWEPNLVSPVKSLFGLIRSCSFLFYSCANICFIGQLNSQKCCNSTFWKDKKKSASWYWSLWSADKSSGALYKLILDNGGYVRIIVKRMLHNQNPQNMFEVLYKSLESSAELIFRL